MTRLTYHLLTIIFLLLGQFSNGQTNQHKQAEDSLQKIIKNYTEAIELNPKNIEAYYKRGFAKVGLKDDRGAIIDYTKALGLNPKEPEGYYFRADAKGRLKDYKGAIQDYTKALKLNPTNIYLLYYRGTSKYNSGDNKGACLDWSKAAETGVGEAKEAISKYCK